MYVVDQQTLLNKPRTAICAELTKSPQGLDTMETEVSPSLEQFMQSPLVTWVRTFGQVGDLQGGMLTEYKELADGTFLNKIMDQINPEVAIQGINKANGDERQRTQNLSVLTHRIKSYYQESLQQLIMLPLPNAVVLGRSPFCEQSLDEMKKLLLLLLGCAVQCENKEEYIERIQTLDFDTKASIASHIQEVTHCQENVFDLHWLDVSDLCPEELVSLSRNMAVHLSRLVDQRDLHLESIAKLTQERDCVHSDDPSPAGSSRIHQAVSHEHLGVELADSKARIRRLRQELEEKSEQLLDCRQELESTEAGVKKLQQENMQLLTDARAARTYRDELDALREKAIRADKLESEVGRYRERLHNMEFYKAKVEELKEDNQVLLETKALLEEQMEGSRACSEKLHQLEKHTVHLQAKLQDMEEERALSRRCMEELLEEKVALELAQRRSMEESCRLGWELEQVSKDPAGTVQKSLGQEVTESACSRLLRLERENQSLQKALQELRGAWRPLEDPSNSTSHAVEVNGLTEKVELSDKDTISPNERSVETSLKYSNLELELNGRSPRLERESERSFGQEKASLEAEPGSLKEKEKEQLALQHTAELLSTQDRYSPETGSRLSALTKQLGVPEPVLTQSCETENRQLRSALENAGRKLRRLDAQLQELETENQALQSSAEELRISGRRLDQLEAEKRALEQDHAQLERDRGRLEKENRRLRQRADIQEASLEGSTMRQSSLERENRVLTKEATALKEACTRTKELEGDNQELLKQAAASKRTMANLREELVGEKLKTQQKQNELEKLSHELSRMGLDQERLMSDQETTEHSRYKQLESELEASLKRSLEIKEEKIAALEARLQESSSLNQQLRQELRTVKQNYEALAQREEEERVGRSSPPQAGREWQRESQEATQELLRVKDRLIEVERNNARLQAERQALQAQLQQLQAQSQGLQAQIVALQRQTATLQESNTALQTHNAQLQVEKSTISSQGASLMAQNARLQRQQFSVEGEKESALRDRDDLRTVNELLLRDHERLAALHEKQTAEFEVLVAKHGELKTSHHSLGLEQRSLEDRYNTLLQQKAQLEGVEKALKEEQEKMQQETENHRRTSAECQRLRDEKDWLNQTYQKLLQDHEGLQADHRNLRCTLNSSKLEQTRLESELAKLRQQHQHLDVESAKLTNQCELLTQLKGNLEEENRHLLEQIQSLMLQNRTLLEQTMESKDLFHVEQRQYIDKLNELRRQKEKLEEKIMDQYRFYDPPSPRRRGNWITLKVKKLIKSRSRERERVRSLTPPARSESCEGLPDLRCHDNGSFVGSQGSAESVSNSFNGEALSPKRSSISALKMFHVMRHRQKEKDKVKPSRRSLSLNDLMHAEVCWERGVARPAGGATEPTTEEHLPSMNHTADMSIHHPMPPFNHPHHSTGKDLHANATPPAHDDVPHMPSNMPSGDQSRAQSQSSGEFSMSLENEAWSGGSSPIQEPPLRRPSNPSPPALPAPVQERDGGPVPRSTGRGVWRSSSGRRSSGDPPTQRQDSARKELRKTGSVRESCSLSGLGLQAQGKSSSASGCLNCFATPLRREGRPKSGLPRASCVISTSEGASRRASIHGAHSARSGRSDPVSPGGTGEGRRGDEPPPGPPPALTEASAEAGMEGASPEEEVVPSAFPFTIDSVFTNTIFSDPVLSSGCDTHQSGGRGADKLDVDAARSAVAQDGGGLSQNGRPCTGYEDDEAVDHMAVYDQASNPPEKTLVA